MLQKHRVNILTSIISQGEVIASGTSAKRVNIKMTIIVEPKGKDWQI